MHPYSEKRRGKSNEVLGSAHPILQVLGYVFRNALQREISQLFPTDNFVVEFTEGLRSYERQQKLKAEGRSKADPGLSLHNWGLALDFAFYHPERGLYDWLEEKGEAWTYVKHLTQDLGLTWGGNWTKFVDKPHLSLTLGFATEKECCIWAKEQSDLKEAIFTRYLEKNIKEIK